MPGVVVIVNVVIVVAICRLDVGITVNEGALAFGDMVEDEDQETVDDVDIPIVPMSELDATASALVVGEVPEDEDQENVDDVYMLVVPILELVDAVVWVSV